MIGIALTLSFAIAITPAQSQYADSPYSNQDNASYNDPLRAPYQWQSNDGNYSGEASQGYYIEPSAGSYSNYTVPRDSDDAWLQMQRIIKENFASWTGGDEQLSMRQVGRLERMPEITGQQAAVLGLIGQFMVHQIKTDQGREPSFTLDKLLSRLQAKTVMRTHFLTAMKELASDSNRYHQLSLYGDSGQPTLDGIHQAGLGDCFALSAIEAVLFCRGPQYIKSLIQPTGINEYLVSLPGAHPLTIKLTEAEIAQGNVSPGNGCWLQLLGIALDQLKAENIKPGRSRIRRIKNRQIAQTPMGVLAVGGSQPVIFHWLTGEQYTALSRRKNLWNEGLITRTLNLASSQDCPTGVSTRDHCLSVVGWDRDSQTVTVFNPWGTSDHYSPNGTDRFLMDNGRFKVSIDQLMRNFTSIDVPKRLLDNG